MEGQSGMNVLLITSDVNVLKDGTAARLRVEQYSSLCHRLVVIVINKHRDRFEPRKISKSLWLIPTNSYVSLLSPLGAVRAGRRELCFQGTFQADLISADDPCGAGIAAAILAWQYAKPLHVSIERNIFTPHFWSEAPGNALRAYIARTVIRHASGIQVSSENIRAAIAGVGASVGERTRVVPYFIDVQAFRDEAVRVDLRAKYPQFNIVVLVVAPLTQTHNVQHAITIVSEALKRYSHIGLVIVGEGRLRSRLKALAAHLRIGDRVIFENWTENLSSYFKTAHIFLVTSREDEYDHTIQKAAASGSVIVTTPVGTAESFLEDKVSGFLCEPHDTTKFVDNIMEIINHNNTREFLKLNARAAVEKIMADEGSYLAQCKESWERAAAPSDTTYVATRNR